MFVKEITIDGFKSYAQRQVVAGFDPQFNAITGLNGSGKSNILDSICFVLGIQNLQQVGAWGGAAGCRQNPLLSCRMMWAGRQQLQAQSAGTTVCVPLFPQHTHSTAGARQQPAGAGVQAGAGGHHQGHSVHRV